MKMLMLAFAVLAGISNPIQSAANAALSKTVGPILTVAAVYAVAIMTLVLVAPVLGVGKPAKFAEVPWWAWTAGLCNIIFVLVGTTVTRKIGSATFVVTTLTAAVIVSILLDQFALMGLPQRSITLWRVLGGGLAIAGVVMVARG